MKCEILEFSVGLIISSWAEPDQPQAGGRVSPICLAATIGAAQSDYCITNQLN